MFMTERHIFISYRRADPDYTFAHHLADDLRAAGHPVWIDVEGIDGADEWAREIQGAIDQCYAYLIILSPDSVDSVWVRKEMIYALGEKQGRLYPVLYRDVRVPFELGDLQYTDFLRQDYETAWDKLLEALPSPDGLLPMELLYTVESERAMVRRGAVSVLIEFAQAGTPGQRERAERWLDHLRVDDPNEQVRVAADRYFNPPEPPAPVAQAIPIPEPAAGPERVPQSVETIPVNGGFTFKPWMAVVGLLVLAAVVGVVLLLTRPDAETAVTDEPVDLPTESLPVDVPVAAPTITPTVPPTALPATEPAAAAVDPTATSLPPTPTPLGGSDHIAFIAQSPERQDVYDLYVINPNGGNPIRLTSGDVNVKDFSWSPDGTRLAYMEGPQGKQQGDLYIMLADGTGRQLIAEQVLSFQWLPYGLRLQYFTASDNGEFVINEDDETQFPQPRLSRWAPDRSTTVWESDDEAVGGEIYKWDPVSETIIRLTYNEATDRAEGWLQDGRIIFSSNRSGDFGVYVMDADGENVVLVAEHAWLEDIMASGQHLLVTSWREGDRKLYSVSLDGNEWVRLSDETANSGASISPDGTKIAFWAWRDLVVMNVDGSDSVSLASFGNIRDEIMWQPSP